jgi:hypothetical protein
MKNADVLVIILQVAASVLVFGLSSRAAPVHLTEDPIEISLGSIIFNTTSLLLRSQEQNTSYVLNGYVDLYST